jgi:RNA polymerase sigma-70 factor, ECF subfamily
MPAAGSPVTVLLRRMQTGDESARDELVSALYPELKKMAHRVLVGDGQSRWQNTTGLVHDYYLRLIGSEAPQVKDRVHFLGITARLMRQILVDQARERLAAKRGRSQDLPLDFEVARQEEEPLESLLDLSSALDKLTQRSAQQAHLIEMHYFGGMTAEECAEAANLSVHVVRHELRFAKAWLAKTISE